MPLTVAQALRLGAVKPPRLMPKESGIYFLSTGDVVEYIGMAVNLRNRLYADHPRKANRTVHILPTPHSHIITLERRLIMEFRPPLNEMRWAYAAHDWDGLSPQERRSHGCYRTLACAVLGRRWGFGLGDFISALEDMRISWNWDRNKHSGKLDDRLLRVTKARFMAFPKRDKNGMWPVVKSAACTRTTRR